jgi:hypothetical protein
MAVTTVKGSYWAVEKRFPSYETHMAEVIWGEKENIGRCFSYDGTVEFRQVLLLYIVFWHGTF